MKEWECPAHGYFESTHPLCPELGCLADCNQVFLTPPTVSDGVLKRFDASTKKSVDMMKLGNLRTARAGESAYGTGGRGMLWGNDVQKQLGVSMETLVANAAAPLVVKGQKIDKSVMRELAAEGMTKKVLPRPAELIGDRRDRK